MCGNFFCSAATTSACESPVFCDTNAINFGTSAAAPPREVPIGSAMSTFLEMMSMPARAPVRRTGANAGLAASRTFCPSLRRGIRFRPRTTVTTTTPTTSTTIHCRTPDRLPLLPCIKNLLMRWSPTDAVEAVCGARGVQPAIVPAHLPRITESVASSTDLAHLAPSGPTLPPRARKSTQGRWFDPSTAHACQASGRRPRRRAAPWTRSVTPAPADHGTPRRLPFVHRHDCRRRAT